MKEILVFCGKSGSGKDYIPKLLNLKQCPGNTTRIPRDTDMDYTFFSKEQYEKEINKNKIVIPTNYCDNYYWTNLADFENEQFDFIVANVEGVIDLLKDVKIGKITRPIKFIYVKCSMFRRIQNMRSRGDSIKNIYKRLHNDQKDFYYAKKIIFNNKGFLLYS